MHIKKTNISKTQNFIQGLRPLSKTIPRGFKGILKKSGYNFSNVIENWAKIVGKDISNFCYPINIKQSKDAINSVLIINVMHGKELEAEYKKQEIINKVNMFFGYNYVKQIKSKIIQEKKETNLNYTKKINKKKFFIDNLEKVKNENLKKSLNKLIKAYNDKSI